jgi:hypothetical protein
MAKKMVVIVMEEGLRDRVEEALEAAHVMGFSEIPEVLGEGRHGKRFASRVHPGANSVVFAVVEEETVPALKAAMVALGAGSGQATLHLTVLPVEDFL